MKKVLVFLAMIMAMSVASEVRANDIIQNRLPIFKKDNRGMKVTPLVVYNRTTGNYETVYIATDGNGFLNVTVASGTINAAVAGPVAVTGTFWQATQPVSGAFYPVTQPVSGSVDVSGSTTAVILYSTLGNAIYVDDIDIDTVITSQNALGTLAFGYSYNAATQRWTRNRSNAVFEPFVQLSSQTVNIVTDEWQYTHSSTGTSGFLNAAGVIPDTNFDLTSRVYYVVGGDATVTESWRTGTIYLFEYQPWNPPALKTYPTGPTITVTSLTAGASIYYDIEGGN